MSRLIRVAHARERFNLVIERLLISGGTSPLIRTGNYSFNLVIERLLISGQPSRCAVLSGDTCFNLVIERLLISGSNPFQPSG